MAITGEVETLPAVPTGLAMLAFRKCVMPISIERKRFVTGVRRLY
jgi:hypothetical protein